MAIYLSGAAWIAVAIVTLVDITGRSIFNTPIYGSFEIVKLMMSIGLLFSMPIVAIKESQVVVELVTQHFSRPVKQLIRYISAIAGSIFFGFISISLANLTLSYLTTAEHSVLWELPYWLIAGGISVVSGLTVLCSLVHCFVSASDLNVEGEAIDV